TTVAGNASAGGTGITVNGTVNGGSLSGTSANGTGAQVSDGASITSGSISGVSDTGTGTVVQGNITTSGQITGQSDKGTGLDLNGSLSGNGTLKGYSANGSGVLVSGDSHLDGVNLNGTTTNGTALNLNGTLGHTPDSVINNKVTEGGSGHVSGGHGEITTERPSPSGDDHPGHEEQPDEYVLTPQVKATMNGTQATTGQMARDGVHLVSGYRPEAPVVDIEVCSDGDCQLLTVPKDLTSSDVQAHPSTTVSDTHASVRMRQKKH
ncbi:TPA: hypothetical protein MND73_004782, partial [Salmonella enterica subsp. houtenae]|nr:hypothetical protein [Salmonella enterica subsp. houtenae]